MTPPPKTLPATAGLALAFGLSLGGAARADDDFQAWPTVQVTGKVRPDGLAAYAEGQLRLNDDAGRVLLKIVRLGLGKEWTDGHNVYGGYAWYESDPLGRPRNTEHRMWQQLGYPILKRGPLQLTGRMRLEQRFREDLPDAAFRMRQMLRAQYKLGDGTRAPSLVAHSELFTEFADTRWGVKARAYDQVRTFAGVRTPFTQKIAVEAGYLNQTLNGRDRNGLDRGGPNHILLATLAMSW